MIVYLYLWTFGPALATLAWQGRSLDKVCDIFIPAVINDETFSIHIYSMMKHYSLHDDLMSPPADLVLSKGLQYAFTSVYSFEKSCSYWCTRDPRNRKITLMLQTKLTMEFPIEMCKMLTFQFTCVKEWKVCMTKTHICCGGFACTTWTLMYLEQLYQRQ